MTVECSCAKQRPQRSLPDEKPGIHERLNMMKTWSFIMSSSRSEAWDGVAGVPSQEESLHALLACPEDHNKIL